MRLKLTSLAFALLTPLAAFAQEQPPLPPPPGEPPPPPADPAAPPPPPMDATAPAPEAAAPAAAAGPVAIKWEGLVDSYYMYNITGDPSTQGPGFRAFDDRANSFNLAYAKLGLGVDTELASFRVDFGYGHTGAIINFFSAGGSGVPTPAMDPNDPASPDPRALFLYGNAFVVQQAFGTVKFGTAVTLDAGKFVTTAGSEVIESNKNWLYSRSFLFNGIPLLHTGLRLNIKPSDTFTIQATVANGGATNNDPDNNEWKTVGLSLGFTPLPTTSLLLTSYFGKEGPTGNQGDLNVLVDLVVNQTISDAFALNLNFDYFKQGENPYWLGAALMGKFSLSEAVYLAARGEFLMAKKGGYGLTDDTNLFEGTVAAGLPFGSNFEIRLEVRGDFSDKEVFFKGAEARKNQFTGTAGFLAYF